MCRLVYNAEISLTTEVVQTLDSDEFEIKSQTLLKTLHD